MYASEAATETVWQVAMQQSKYWNCMHPKTLEPREGRLRCSFPSIRELDAARNAQKSKRTLVRYRVNTSRRT